GNGCGKLLAYALAQFDLLRVNCHAGYCCTIVFHQSANSSFQCDAGLFNFQFIGIVGLNHGAALVQLCFQLGIAGTGIIQFVILAAEQVNQLAQTLGVSLAAQVCICLCQSGAGSFCGCGIGACLNSLGSGQSLVEGRPSCAGGVSFGINAASVDQLIQTAQVC